MAKMLATLSSALVAARGGIAGAGGKERLANGDHVYAHSNGGEIFVIRYNATTGFRDAPVRANAWDGPVTYAASAPCVAGLQNGGFVVAWMVENQDSDDLGVYAQLFDRDGLFVGGEFKVNSYVIQAQQDPVCSGLTGGGFVIMWVDAGHDGDKAGVFGQTYSQFGGRMGTAFQVNDAWVGSQSMPEIAATPDGGFATVWLTYHAAGVANIFVRKFAYDGTPETGDVMADTNTGFELGEPSIECLSDGNLGVSWSEYDQHNNWVPQIFARLLSSTAVVMGPRIVIQGYASFTGKASLAAFDGLLFAVWPDTMVNHETELHYRLLFNDMNGYGPATMFQAIPGVTFSQPSTAPLSRENKVVLATGARVNAGAGSEIKALYESTVSVIPPSCSPLIAINGVELANVAVGSNTALPSAPVPLADIPGFFGPTSAYFLPSLPFDGSKTVKFHCCEFSDDGCDVFAAMPHCPPCTTSINGGYPGILLADGWSAATCAPSFPSTYIAHSITFHKRMAPGETYEFPAPAGGTSADWLVFFGSQEYVADIFCPTSIAETSGPAATCMPCAE
eukprot:gene11786-18179_t